MENELLNKIHHLLIEFRRATGRRPKFIYLGYNELNLIKGPMVYPVNPLGVGEICGVELVIVNKESHLALSFQ